MQCKAHSIWSCFTLSRLQKETLVYCVSFQFVVKNAQNNSKYILKTLPWHPFFSVWLKYVICCCFRDASIWIFWKELAFALDLIYTIALLHFVSFPLSPFKLKIILFFPKVFCFLSKPLYLPHAWHDRKLYFSVYGVQMQMSVCLFSKHFFGLHQQKLDSHSVSWSLSFRL